MWVYFRRKIQLFSWNPCYLESQLYKINSMLSTNTKFHEKQIHDNEAIQKVVAHEKWKPWSKAYDEQADLGFEASFCIAFWSICYIWLLFLLSLIKLF